MSWKRSLMFQKVKNHVPNRKAQQSWGEVQIISGERNLKCLTKYIGSAIAKRIIILAHPYRVESKDFLLENGHAKLYLELGYQVYIFDFNGFGESEFIDFDYHYDLHTIATHVKSSIPMAQITVHGISFGAAACIKYASLQYHLADKVIIENALTQYDLYFKKRNILIYYILQVIKLFNRAAHNEHDYLAHTSLIQRPEKLLLIYGAKDELTTAEMGKEHEQASKVKVQYELFDCSHMKAINTDKIRYIEILKNYIET